MPLLGSGLGRRRIEPPARCFLGFRMSWLAVKGVPLSTLVGRAGWSDTGDTLECMDTGLYGIALTGGWSLVAGDGSEFMEKLTADQAKGLSTGTVAVFLTLDEGSMCAAISGFEAGTEIWAVEYDGYSGVSAPVVRGAAPNSLPEIVARFRDEQARAGGEKAGVDFMWEIAPELG